MSNHKKKVSSNRNRLPIILSLVVVILAVIAVILLFRLPDKSTKQSGKESVKTEVSSKKKEKDSSLDQEDKKAGSKGTEKAEPEEPKEPAESKEPVEAKGNGHIVCIDPGHQRSGESAKEPNGPNSKTMKARVTGGTRGTTTGVYEYELTLTISQALKTELEKRGYTVYMTRDSHDVKISNMERAQYATQVNADIYFRIHANGAGSSSANGAMMLTPSASNPYVANLASKSKTLSQDVLTAYCQATGMKNLGVQANDTMTGLNWATMPMTLIELGFMTNPRDDKNMEDAAYQAKMVQGMANGIDAYFQGQ
ncbi:MAG: N-acetylmuramoyl-L-alanine amidase [Lachnospiraceae bacterium]|nr:N-acetylmuramoyl-L-alanine amidase [Lachnospiraceae bacterium]